MYTTMAFFGIIIVLGSAFIWWMHTKKGKKWLEEL